MAPDTAPLQRSSISPETRLLLVAVGLLAMLAPSGAAQNVLLVLADEVGVTEVGTYGENPQAAPTPTLDALAAHGVLFRNAWAHPVCSPTRFAIYSGLHANTTGLGTSVGWSQEFDPSFGYDLLPELLPGHATILIGKWHLTNRFGSGFLKPVFFGFDEHRGSIKNIGATNSYTAWEKNIAIRQTLSNSQFTQTTYATTDAVDDALAFINGRDGQPWFCVLAFNAAHNPWHDPPAELHDISPLDSVPQQFKASIQAMDTELGRLLTSLSWRDQQTTTVIYIGDNGAPSPATDPFVPPGRGKGSVYEGGVNVPLVIASARIPSPGRECHAPVMDVDLFATVLELAGLADIPPSDGLSLVPYLMRPGQPDLRPWAFTEGFSPNGPGPYDDRLWAVRGRRYKLLEINGQQHLFDLARDPGEQHDLLARPLDRAQQQAYDALLATAEQIVN